jgi:t-SNARE complex subunit (syntaxin)
MAISKDQGTPSDFERFRRDRKLRRNKQQVTVARGDRVQRDTIRQIEERERSEANELRLTREMYEFVEETTRLAATILKDIAAQYQQNQSNQITNEMSEFFSETLRRAENLSRTLNEKGQDSGSLQLAIAELEPLLENISTEELDQFRAEGSLEGQRHMGQHPASELMEQNQEAEQPSQVRDDAQEATVLPGSEGFEEPGLGENEDGSVDLEPLASDEFYEDEFADDGAVLEDPLSWRPTQHPEPEPEVEPAPESMPVAEPEAEGPAPVESEDLFDTEEESPGLPLGLDNVAHDPAKLKKALTLMVQNGLLSREDANDAWKRARDFARSGPAPS